ncbi:MAG: response regulator transcription factor [Rhodocyclaceae bacterium]
MGALMQAYRKAMLFDYTALRTGDTGADSASAGSHAMKILVVDDHPLIRSALRYALAELDTGVDLLDASDGASALRELDAHPDLDLVLLDLALPDMDGLQALKALRERSPAVPIVVLSASEDPEAVRAALDAGAMGFVPKSSSNQVMLSALRLVLSGGVYVPLQALSADRSGAHPAAELGLTQRQAEVLALMVQGKPNKLICRELGLAQGTVKIHVTAILKALDVSNRTQAVIKANRLGLCPVPPKH